MKSLIPLFLCGLAVSPLPAAVRLQLVVEKQLQAPVAVTHAGDGSGRLFVCEQRGLIRVVKAGILQPAPFLDLGPLLVSERAGFDERGLLGLAFHPQYEQAGQPGEGRFYVFYSAPPVATEDPVNDPHDCLTTIAEYRVSTTDPDQADPASARILLTFSKPQFNHNGGQLAFGPDGFLYASTGDGGSSNDNNAGHTGGSAARPTDAVGNSQDLTNLMGKLLRIDPLGTDGPGGAYGIPAGNPLIGQGGGVREEIWCWGLRNPWRFSFDMRPGGTNRLFCADVGQGQVEEVNILTVGGNSGWRNREGTFTPDFSEDAPLPGTALIDPIAQYAHPGVTIGSPELPQIGVSVTGGYLYRGAALPELQGRYIFGDYSATGVSPDGVLMQLVESAGSWTLSPLDVEGGNPIGRFVQAFGEDESGELYIACKQTRSVSQLDNGLPAGSLLKLVPVPAAQTTTLAPAADATIYSEGTADGRGDSLFAGDTAQGNTRRALLRFDLTALPAGAQVTAASLGLTLDKTITGAVPVSAHRVTASWNEGPAQAGGQGGSGTAAGPGDVTWTSRNLGTGPAWTTPGGDFLPTASATVNVGAVGAQNRYTWSGAGLVADLQHWLSAPAENAGWILTIPSAGNSAKRFVSREGTTPAVRPSLEISYVSAPVLTRRQQWEAEHFFAGEFIDPAGDPDGDGLASLLEYGWDLPAKSAGTSAGYFTVQAAAGGFSVVFRRDPRATDLTYRLETATALNGWAAVATSTGGAPATGAAVTGESAAAPSPLVEVSCFVPTTEPRAFVRLAVTR